MQNPKSQWGEGPWQTEPDSEYWVDKNTGLDCCIKRHQDLGHLCGYVRVPKEHPLFDCGYNYPADWCSTPPEVIWWRRYVLGQTEYALADIDVHGGLSFSGPIKVTRGPEKDKWFGFDCGHFYDLSPGIRKLVTGHLLGVSGRNVYRDWNYVKDEVTKLAKQLAMIKQSVVRKK